jgi:hypothetical protein
MAATVLDEHLSYPVKRLVATTDPTLNRGVRLLYHQGLTIVPSSRRSVPRFRPGVV